MTRTPLLEVLIPTCDRKAGLAITLMSLFGQTYRDFDVVVSDQSECDGVLLAPELQTLVRAFKTRRQRVRYLHHLPRRGMAEQRHFLLSRSHAKYVQFVDDDLLIEPEVTERLLRTIEQEQCGFVGCCAIGLSYLYDYRAHQHNLEAWHGRVEPEAITPETIPWERHKVHNAANAYHLTLKYARDGSVLRYKVAWVGANVIYDREKLLAVGGFSWWPQLPVEHAGEDVLAQLMLLRRFGGCGILPSGTYHLELPTLVEDRRVNATSLFRRLISDEPRALGPVARRGERVDARERAASEDGGRTKETY